MTVDYRWHGSPEAVAAAYYPGNPPLSVIGPRELDGVCYLAVRMAEPAERPAGLEDTGVELSLAILGGWAE